MSEALNPVRVQDEKGENPLLNAVKLTKRFRKSLIIEAMDLRIEPSDRIALIGANGAGKTTLIRSILGQYQVQGSLDLFGLDPRKNRISVLDRIGFVPQHSPPLQMNVGELVELYTGLVSKLDQQRLHRIAEALGISLKEHRKQAFVKLSGGMRQKILIALALAREPELLIMDEPASNLDPIGRKAFFAELAKLAPSTTMLLSSHRVDEVAGLINRIIEMDCGKIVLDERIGVSEMASQSLECRVLLQSGNPTAQKILVEWGFNQATGDANSFEGSIHGADRLRFFNALARFSGHIKSLKVN